MKSQAAILLTLNNVSPIYKTSTVFTQINVVGITILGTVNCRRYDLDNSSKINCMARVNSEVSSLKMSKLDFNFMTCNPRLICKVPDIHYYVTNSILNVWHGHIKACKCISIWHDSLSIFIFMNVSSCGAVDYPFFWKKLYKFHKKIVEAT